MKKDKYEEETISESYLYFKQNIEVYCAWCNKYLYKSQGMFKKNHKASHGICSECSEKVFRIII